MWWLEEAGMAWGGVLSHPAVDALILHGLFPTVLLCALWALSALARRKELRKYEVRMSV